MENLEKISILGKGSFSTVNLVQDRLTKKKFAQKKVCPGSDEPNDKILSEGNILQTLKHPNIIRFYDSFLKNEKFYMLLEYAPRGDLSKLIKEMKLNSAYFSEAQIRSYLTQIAMGIKYVHEQKIQHRDIKLNNILIDENGIEMGVCTVTVHTQPKNQHVTV